MSMLVGLIEFIIGCLTLLAIAFMVTLVMPDSPMKQFATQVIGWTVAFVCGFYVVCPDPLPVVLDDIGALMLGIGGAMAAKRAGKDSKGAAEPVTRTVAERHERGPRSRIQHHSDSK